MHRHPNRPAEVGDRALDRLADPPRRVGRKFEPAAIVELVDALHQTEVAFLNQVEQRQAAVQIALRDRYHQAQIRLHQLLFRAAHLLVAFERARDRLLELAARLAHARDGLAQLARPRRALRLGVELAQVLHLFAKLRDDAVEYRGADRLGGEDLANLFRGVRGFARVARARSGREPPIVDPRPHASDQFF